ncbi:MAG: flagellar hook-associated protein FlgK [Bryobacterales bacterium]|nr:flagellar hook-associated protein FlgK [Bryobacterales bacterium]MBV9401041.1 flagellar hook-associated protein FlgK [Bryobacterales bacterium]
MGSLTTSLLNASGALNVYGRALNVIQNNISNANTPGYVEQDQTLIAEPFDGTNRTAGGIIAGPIQSARSEYLEQNVRNQAQVLGYAQQRASDLGQVQPVFSPTSTSSISAMLNKFFSSFSQLSVNPNDPTERQSVINAAGQVAESFNQAATGIQQVSSNVDSQTHDLVPQINKVLQQITALNQQYAADASSTQDAGLDAQMHSALENLSTMVNFSLVKSNTGQYNVFTGGTPLVVGDHEYPISADFSSPQTVIRDAQGNDITSELTGGQLGALLGEKNTTLPHYMELLNSLAATFADEVNQQLSQGVDQNGQPPSMGLFTYRQTSNAASTLAVTNIAPDQIAAASAGSPGGNGNAIALAQLASAPLVNGFTFTQAYGNLSAQVGTDVAQAQQDQTDDKDLLTQAQQTRSQQTGVSLNAEAAKLLQVQQTYDAIGKLISTISDLTLNVINLIPPVTS